MPLISVVLIFLNEERFLEEAIRSVCSQTLTDWELILVDDGSTDHSTDIAKSFVAADRRIRYVEHTGHANRGMAASRNFGVTHSSSPYLAFMDGDDVWVPEKLADQFELLERMPDVAMVHGALRYWRSWDPDETRADDVVLTGGVANHRFEPPQAALAIYPLGPADGAGVDLLVRRTTFDAVGGFEERFRGLLEDQSFILKVFMRYPIYISASTWIWYRQHSESACAQTSRADYLRLRGTFLDWLAGEVAELGDAQVCAAHEQAVARLRRRKLLIPLLEFAAQIPERHRSRVKRLIRRNRPG